MNSLPNSSYPTGGAPSFAVRLEDTSAAIGGAAAVGTIAAIHGLVRWLVKSDAWIFFFLTSKPIIDLTWRWEFVRVFNQRVNPQAIVAVLVVVLNSLAAVFGRRKPRYSALVMALLGLATFSVLLSPTSWGINELIRLFSGASFFFTAGFVLRDKKKFDRFAMVLLATVCVPLILSLFQAAGVLPYEYWDWLDGLETGRVSGTYQHPLELVFFLVYTVPLALYRWEQAEKGSGERIFLVAFFLLAACVLGFTLHRAGWIAIAAELVIWFGSKRQLKKILFGWLALVVLAVLFTGWLSVFFEPVTEIVTGEADFATGNIMRGRGLIWISFLNSYANGGPVRWIVGRGDSVAQVSLPGIVDYAENEPHNDFLRMLHAYGLAGLLLYLGLLVVFLREGLRLRGSGVPFQNRAGGILVASVAGIVVLSLTTEPMRYPTGIWYLFVLASVVVLQGPDLMTAAGRIGGMRTQVGGNE
jgi:O-antigen ligase